MCALSAQQHAGSDYVAVIVTIVISPIIQTCSSCTKWLTDAEMGGKQKEKRKETNCNKVV